MKLFTREDLYLVIEEGASHNLLVLSFSFVFVLTIRCFFLNKPGESFIIICGEEIKKY